MNHKQVYHYLQMRFPAKIVLSGMELSFRNKKFTLGASMPQTLAHSNLPIGVVVNGYTRQFELLQDGKRVGAAWFYFYCSFQGMHWGILDEIALVGTSSNEL